MKHFLTILLLLPVVFGACRKDDMCEQKIDSESCQNFFHSD